MKLPIYLDYAATCPVDKRVAQKMMQYLTMDGVFGNPASRSHSYGWEAESAVDDARSQVAAILNAKPSEIVFTSGATESNNLAILGAAHYYQDKGKHIITSVTEHKAVLDTCKQLEKEGFDVTYLTPEKNGIFQIENIVAAMREDTILVSIMHVNNEIGVIQDIDAIANLCRERGIIFHVDCAQSAGKLPIDVQKTPVDLLSISGHKIYGPKGIGALYVRRNPRVHLDPIIHGGGHERGMRSGTLVTHQIVGLGEALRIAKEEMEQDTQHIKAMRDRLLYGIQDIEEIYINGDLEQRIVSNLNVSFGYVEGEALLMALKDLAISTGSACTSANSESSYVLRSLGIEDQLAHSSIRFSFGRYTTAEEIDHAIDCIHQGVARLRALSPLWEMYKDGVDMNNIKWDNDNHH